MDTRGAVVARVQTFEIGHSGISLAAPALEDNHRVRRQPSARRQAGQRSLAKAGRIGWIDEGDVEWRPVRPRLDPQVGGVATVYAGRASL